MDRQHRDFDVSHLIPLYRSSRFHDVISANIRDLAGPEAEILLADRNGDAAYCDRLRREFADIPNLRVITRSDNATWVENIADLIAAARGRYLRILPHDDSASREGLAAMRRVMETDPGVVLVYGRIEAIALDGTRMPDKDEVNAGEDPAATRWTLADVLPMFWTGRFRGAFKGLVRRDVAQRAALRFRATPQLAHSERAWLFGLGLSGRMQFVPETVLRKRYHTGSTHRSWARTPEVIRDAARLMAQYAADLLPDAELAEYARRDLLLNADLRADALAAGRPHPPYRPLPHSRADLLRASPLPGHGGGPL